MTLAEARALFAPFAQEKSLVVAVSGGPDSTALLWLAAQWRASRKAGPMLVAVTVDHGLRAGSATEARAVARLARGLQVSHRTARWTGVKPRRGVQEAARAARYALLAAAARKAGARIILTAHTLDDQAETVLLRLLRGSGPSGLQAMRDLSPCPADADIALARPLLDIAKSRLVATLRKAGIAFADDPSNRDPRHTRPRLRALLPELEREGLTARRLALLARRLQRIEAALRHAVAQAVTAVSRMPWGEGSRIVLDRARFRELPQEIALRLLGQAVAHAGDEGPVELGKLETLFAALTRPDATVCRRTLAGALISRRPGEVTIERAPPRRSKAAAGRRISALTTSKTVPADTARKPSG